LKHIESVEDSRKLVNYEQPCVIISASGTADAGRVRHHINECIGKENNGILFVGFCGNKSLGGQLLNGSKEVEIFSDPCNVLAEIGQLQGMSAHGDTDDLVRFLSNQDADKVKSVYLVHGEYDTQKTFADRLALKGFRNIEIPDRHQHFDLSRPAQKQEEKIVIRKDAA
jgi:metallo-beta-lactamase family protein